MGQYPSRDSIVASIGKCRAVSTPPQTAPARLIRDIQRALAAKGFSPGTPDGIMGPSTRNAIKKFQKSIGLPETGQPSAELLMLLKAQ